MEKLTELISNFISLSAEASPWLLLGLLIAGLMKTWLPSQLLNKHLGNNYKSIIKAALIGAPLPLCSCGVIPVATELRRSGASAPATTSFLVATPETGVDSVSVSYAMLGPIFAIYRPVTAILSAILTGLLVATIKTPLQNSLNKQEDSTSCQSQASNSASESCCDTAVVTPPKTACCSSNSNNSNEQVNTKANACSSTNATELDDCCDSTSLADQNSATQKTLQGIKYAATQLIDDIIIWLAIGLIFATLVQTFIPPSILLQYGSGLSAMLMMILISIPMYICATASTPIAAGLILAGLSPGTALVFMMAGPASNISTLGVIKNEMGKKVLALYLIGVSLCAIGFGSLLDFSLTYYSIDIKEQMQHSHVLLPHWFNLSCALLLTFLAIKPLRKQLF